MLRDAGHQLGYALIVALTWIAVVEFNESVFSGAQLTLFANFIFLPALLRPLAVLLFGGAGVIGLFIGSMITFPMSSLSLLSLTCVAAAGSLPAWLAITLMRQTKPLSAQLGQDLAGIQSQTIIVIALISSLFNAIAHFVAFWYIPQMQHSFAQLGTMIVGDTIGSFMLLWLVSILLRAFRNRKEDQN